MGSSRRWGSRARGGGGRRSSPVEQHHNSSAVGAQEGSVFQGGFLGLFGGEEPHALGALRDEFTAWAERGGGGGQSPIEPLLLCGSEPGGLGWGVGGVVGVPDPPEVPHMVEHGLLVEDALAAVHDDGAVHKILHPVGAPLQVQRQVPVRPTGHKVVQVLQPSGTTSAVQLWGVGMGGGGMGVEGMGWKGCGVEWT